MLGFFMKSGLPAAAVLGSAWRLMQDEVAGCSKGGPLSEPVEGRASRVRAPTKGDNKAEGGGCGGEAYR